MKQFVCCLTLSSFIYLFKVDECVAALCSVVRFFLNLEFEDATRFIYIKNDAPGVSDPDVNSGVFEPYFARGMN